MTMREPSNPRFGSAEHACATALIDLALAEDLRERGDLTSDATIPSEAQGAARFEARTEGVIAGLPVVALLAERFAPGAEWKAVVDDGDHVASCAVVGRISGAMRSLLGMERTA